LPATPEFAAPAPRNEGGRPAAVPGRNSVPRRRRKERPRCRPAEEGDSGPHPVL